MCNSLEAGVVLRDSNGKYDGHASRSGVCSQPSHCWGQAGAVRKCLGWFGGTIGIVTRLEQPGMVTTLTPLWALALQCKKGIVLSAKPTLSLATQGFCQDAAPQPQCRRVSLWGSLFGVCLELMMCLSIVPSHGLQWGFCTCAQLLAGLRHVLLKILVHRFLCLGLGSNVLLGVVPFARDKISHPLPIPSVMLNTSSAITLWLSVTFLWLAQLCTLTSHYRLSTGRCGTETHRESTPLSMAALFPIRFRLFIISWPLCAVKICKVHRSSAHACSILQTMVRFG